MISLHPLCGDHAVLSARQPCVLGRAEPGAEVSVSLAGQHRRTTADSAGLWRAEFPALSPGGPHTIVAQDGYGRSATARDVLLGDVWLASGQSNMEWSLALTRDSAADIAAASEPRLRYFTVSRAHSPLAPAAELRGEWRVCSPETAADMSAVAYYFARRLIAGTNVPCGAIVSAWGGSSIDVWLPESALKARPEYATFVERLAQERARPHDPDALLPHCDPGVSEAAATWSEIACDDSAWETLHLPGLWQNAGWACNGAMWFRSKIQLPRSWQGRELELHLGVVDDHDQTFVNGERIGGIGAETPNWWKAQRIHRVPPHLTAHGELLIAIRVFDIWGDGGVLGPIELHAVGFPGATPLALGGLWRARAELELPLRSPNGPQLAPAGLWNGMIAPLTGVSLDGVLWYQGEADVTRAVLYPRLLSDLIAAWRAAFRSRELPFGIVQLAAYLPRKPEPSEDDWAELREAQRLVALHTPRCGLAVAIDAGDADDIHPRHKRPVGERLALWALRERKGAPATGYSGPLPAEAWLEQDSVCVRFAHAQGLRSRETTLSGFELRGADGIWRRAVEAEIRGDTVLVRGAKASAPCAVRYAWQANPEAPLENGDGLPASPFRLASASWSRPFPRPIEAGA
jgi:sialate O-acetylesterase